MRGLVTSGSVLQPAFDLQQILANNLANSGVAGFRADRAAFERILEAHPLRPGDPLARIGLTARIDESSGPLEETGQPLHLALQGPGYFAVSTPEGERYTRMGDFVLGAEGALQTRSGAQIQTENGPVVVPAAGEFVVAPDGGVLVNGQPAGRLRIVTFPDPTGLRHLGQGLLASDAEPEAAAGYQILQGRLEGSNVSPIHTMVEMMALLRFAEANQRAFQAQDGALEGLIQWATR